MLQGRFWAESFKGLKLPESSFKKFEFEDGYQYVYDEDHPVEDYQHKQPKAKKTYKKINWMKVELRLSQMLGVRLSNDI